MNTLDGKTMAVYGAASGWGKVIARRLKPKVGRMLPVDPKLPDGADPLDASRQADILFFSVTPDTEIIGIHDRVKHILHPEQSAMDNATTKIEIAPTLRAMSEQGLSVCSTHGMCRSDLCLENQNAIIMGVGSNSDRAVSQAVEIYEALGMRISRIAFETHAQVSAVVQGIPHITGRMALNMLRTGLKDLGRGLSDLDGLAPANFTAAMLGYGRVGIQHPGVSARIVRETLRTDLGHNILSSAAGFLQKLGEMDDSELEGMFADDVTALDPDGEWRARCLHETNVVLARLANLHRLSIRLRAKEDKPGLLLDILKIARSHGADLTAIDSDTSVPDEAKHRVEFALGLREPLNDMQGFRAELEAIGCMMDEAA